MMGFLLRGGLLVGMVLGFAVGGLAQTAELPAAPAPSTPAPKASLPSAPMADAPSASPAKPLLVLPKTTYTVPDKSAPAVSTPVDSCYGPAGGAYTQKGPPIPQEMKGALESYHKQVLQEINDSWVRHLTVGQRNAWSRERSVSVRFAVMPNGNIRDAEVTRSSGKPDADAHALDAVKSHSGFISPPAGVNVPIRMCITFGYNMLMEDADPARRDKWEKKP
jgi:TonB family protein